jgi:hypothetical protein
LKYSFWGKTAQKKIGKKYAWKAEAEKQRKESKNREKRKKKTKKKKLELTKKKLRNLEKKEANRQVSVIRKREGGYCIIRREKLVGA